jgi:hypothetical protein
MIPVRRCMSRMRYLTGRSVLAGGMGYQEAWAYCQRPRGHNGDHRCYVAWQGIKTWNHA